MDISPLRSAYDAFIDTARELHVASSPDGEWPPELVLAHVIVSDRQIAGIVALALAGGQPRLDNRATQYRPYLEAVASVAGSWDRLVASVRQTGEELMATAARIESEHARVMVPSYVVDHEHVVIDGLAPLEQIVMVPAMVHLPGHIEQLKSYVRYQPS